MFKYGKDFIIFTLGHYVFKYDIPQKHFTYHYKDVLFFELEKEELESLVDNNALLQPQDYLMAFMGVYITANNNIKY